MNRIEMKLGSFSIAILLLCTFAISRAEQFSVKSPNQMLTLSLEVGEGLTYSVAYNGREIIKASSIALHLASGTILGNEPVVKTTDVVNIDETLYPVLGKNKELANSYQELSIVFEGNYALILRAYNEGVAYRFKTSFDHEIFIESEEANFVFGDPVGSVFPTADPTMRSWERAYDTYSSLAEINQEQFCVTPALFRNEEVNIVIAESDLFSYPGLYLQPIGEGAVKGKWAHYPKTVSDPDDVYAYHRVLERENYLAKTEGTRTFPWRVIIVNEDDKDLLNNELVYKLATASKLEDTSWLRPGKSVWEWWHDAILETDQVESGLNNLSFDLYKYYIDFAAEFDMEYITMDAGWSTNYAAQVCSYAASKDVGVIVWDFINLPIENPDRLTQIKNFGAAGVKIDLIERDDQEAIDWLEQLADECVKRELLLILHGCPKPTGLHRTYPNIVNFEAVRGAECAKWDRTPNPTYHTEFPFIRMLAGPLDYTPGSMRNVHDDEFEPVPHGIPMTMGTKAHELAMYVLFDQPLGYLCDSPVEYRKNMVAMNFLKKVPTTWDQTVPLEGKIGEFAVVARKKDNDWYVGAMTNNESRSITIDFSFLPTDETFAVEVYRDNVQTEQDAKAIGYETIEVTSQAVLDFNLARGGGLAMYLKKAVPTSTSDLEQEREFNLFFNFDREVLNIESPEDIRKIKIFDLLGRLHFSREIPAYQKSLQVNIGHLNHGAYVADVEITDARMRQKFVK